MKRSVGILVGTGALAVSGLVGGGWYWFQAVQAPESARSEGGSVVIAGDQSDSGNTLAMNAQAADTKTNSAPNPSKSSSNNSQAAVNVTTTNTPSPTTGAGNLPSPAEFGIYEQYKNAKNALFVDISSGTGASVASGSQLKVNYRGWLTNGQMFDQSYGKQPFALTEGAHGVISGWEQGLFGMKAGGKRRLIIPPEFGYGGQVTGAIPANSVLVFDVELLEVQ